MAKGTALVGLFLFLTANICSANFSGCDWLRISSNIPLHQGRVYIEERHSVTLTCSKTESYGSNYTVDYIHFHKNNEYADGHPYHRVISNTSVQLHIPHVTEKEWRGIIYCAVPDMSESCHYFTSSLTLWIDVVRRPTPPTITGCVVHNWEYMVCTWEPNKKVQGNHTKHDTSLGHKLLWRITDPASGGGVWYDIPDEELGHDSVAFQSTGFIRNETRFQMGAVYEMVLRVWNIITCPPPGSDCDYVHSQKDFFANTSNLVKPAPPTGLGIDVIDSYNISVYWSAPVTNWPDLDVTTLEYRLCAESQWNYTCFSSVTLPRFHLFVVPFTSYNVTVEVKPVHETDEFWSEPASIAFLTNSTVPEMNPEVVRGGFHLETSDDNTTLVTIYWKRVPEIYYNGEDFQYQILTRPSGVRRQTRDGSRFRKHVPFISADSFSYQLTVSDADGLDVFVQAVNKEGEAPRSTLQPIEIPGRRTVDALTESHPEQVIVEGSEMTIWIHINPNMVTEDSHDSRSPDRLLFTCQRNPGTDECQGDLMWVDMLPKDKHVFTTDLREVVSEPQQLSYNDFLVGVATIRDHISAGIQWNKRDDLYKRGGTVCPPDRLTVDSGTEDNSLAVALYRPQCSSPHGYIDHYVIMYCPHDGQANCSRGEGPMLHVLAGADTNVLLKDLRSDVKYLVQALSVGTTGQKSRWTSSVLHKPTTNSLSSGAIVGIAIGAVVAAALFCFGVYIACRQCNKERRKYANRLDLSIPERYNGSVPFRQNIHFQQAQNSRASVMSSDSGTYSVSPSEDYFHDDGPASQYHALNGKGIVKNGTLLTPKTLIPMTSIDEEPNPEDVDPDVASGIQRSWRWLQDGQHVVNSYQTVPGMETGGTEEEDIFTVRKDGAFTETAFGDPWVPRDSQKAKAMPGGYVSYEDDVFEEDHKPNPDTISQEEKEEEEDIEEDGSISKYSSIKCEPSHSGAVVAAKGDNGSKGQEKQPDRTVKQGTVPSQDNDVAIVRSKDNIAFGRVSVQPDHGRGKANGQDTINGMNLIIPESLSLAGTEACKPRKPTCQSGSLDNLSPCAASNDLQLSNPFGHYTNPFFKEAEKQRQANNLQPSPVSSLGPTPQSSAGSSPSHSLGALATGTVPSLSLGAPATGCSPLSSLGALAKGSTHSPSLGALPGGSSPSSSLGALPGGSTPSSSLGALPGGPTPSSSLGALPGGSTPSPGLGALPRGSTPSPGLGALPRSSTPPPSLGALPGGSTPSSGLGALPGAGTPSPGLGALPRSSTPSPSLGAVAAVSRETPAATSHPLQKPALTSSPLPPRVEALRGGGSSKTASAPSLVTGSTYLPHSSLEQEHSKPQTVCQDADYVPNDKILPTGCTLPEDRTLRQDTNGNKPCNSNNNLALLNGGVCTQEGIARTSQKSLANPLTNGDVETGVDHNRNATLNPGYVPNDGSFQLSNGKTSLPKPASSGIKTPTNMNNAYVPNDGSFQVPATKPRTESSYVPNDGSCGFDQPSVVPQNVNGYVPNDTSFGFVAGGSGGVGQCV